MKYILGQIFSDKKIGGSALLFLAVTLVYEIVSSSLVKYIGYSVSNPGSMEYVYVFAALCMANTILETILWRKDLISQMLYTKLIDNLVDKVLDVNQIAFEKYSISKIETMRSKINTISKALRSITDLVIYVVTIVIVLITIYTIDDIVVIPVIIVITIFLIGIYKLNQKFEEIDSQKDYIGKIRNDELSETIRGFREVRFFNAIERHRKSLHEKNKECYELCRRKEDYSCFMSFFGDSSFTVLQIAGLIYGLKLINDGTLTSGIVVSLMMFIAKLISPCFNVVFTFSDLSEIKEAVKDLTEFMNYNNTIHDGKIKLNCFKNEIVFEDVSFEYDSSNTVLNHINLRIKRGQKVGICGESGGGKSTLLNLLMRSRDVCSGCIKVDGIDIKKLNLASYRHEIGIVSQDIHIFDTSILENIRYAVPNASEQEVIEACKKANLWNFIEKLPDRLNTQVGPEGLKLSGGQKQRISLARIFLKDPEIILLDEATSALDNISERAVKKSLKLLDGKTIIAVAHRLTTIQNYDKIVVIGNHQIIAEGRHDELMKSCKAYQEMNKSEDEEE